MYNVLCQYKVTGGNYLLILQYCNIPLRQQCTGGATWPTLPPPIAVSTVSVALENFFFLYTHTMPVKMSYISNTRAPFIFGNDIYINIYLPSNLILGR